MRFFYTLLLYLITPFILLRLLLRGLKAPAYHHNWRERFGFAVSLPQNCIWIHAVSLGETQAALPLIKSLLRIYPEQAILLTHMTPTGLAHGQKTLGDKVKQAYLPYDYPFAVQRFLDKSRPHIGIIMETELWPNLLNQCRTRGIPLILANARLSARSAGRYGYFPGLAREMLNSFSRIGARTQTDVQYFVGLGAAKERVDVAGNIKFELEVQEDLFRYGKHLRELWGKNRPVWIAASTHEGEEETVLNAFQELRKILPNILLILVPRHPERFPRIAVLCEKAGYITVKRSTGIPPGTNTDIYLGDTMGELLYLYAAADIAFVGGSLVTVGGHNPLEPVAFGLPVLFGKHMFNFAEISLALLDKQIAHRTETPKEIAFMVSKILSDHQKLLDTGKHARLFVLENQGALQYLLDIIETYKLPHGH